MYHLRVFLIGIFLGFVLIRSEVVSWFRIQEMFRFDSIHMYGILGSAVLVAALSLFIIRRFGIRSVDGEPIRLAPKQLRWGNLLGGILFGLGWALTGACPGPLYALVAAGFWIMGVALLSALLGTWVYGQLHRVSG